ncbi:hypothetical protein X943_000040 [Babesia divergens]|uniref:Uncharacterized protein n=1 Tax=Babesia divergens TaxID=32595 RepID=A0AAD9GES2_BABDI|nr:hypothetical protein X943_000040 [Babesia divergens]
MRIVNLITPLLHLIEASIKSSFELSPVLIKGFSFLKVIRANFGTKHGKEKTGMAEQRLIPRTEKQQIRKNILEGFRGFMLNDSLNLLGDLMPFLELRLSEWWKPLLTRPESEPFTSISQL